MYIGTTIQRQNESFGIQEINLIEVLTPKQMGIVFSIMPVGRIWEDSVYFTTPLHRLWSANWVQPGDCISVMHLCR